jgi:hypothetical protein
MRRRGPQPLCLHQQLSQLQHLRLQLFLLSLQIPEFLVLAGSVIAHCRRLSMQHPKLLLHLLTNPVQDLTQVGHRDLHVCELIVQLLMKIHSVGRDNW